MGFFDRSKKVKKGGPSSPPQGRPVLAAQPGQFHASSSQLPSALPPQHWNGPPYQPPPAFQPAGLLPAPAGWHPSTQPPPPYQQARPPYAPMIVNQHYYFTQPPPPSFQQPQRPHTSGGAPGKLNMGALVDAAEGLCPGTGLPQLLSDGLTSWHGHGTQMLDQSAALYDQLSTTFNDVMTSIDREAYSGDEKDLFVWQPEPGPRPSQPSHGASTDRGGFTKRPKKSNSRDNSSKGNTATAATSLVTANCFAKVELYANSRLPMDLPPLKLYIPTYPLLCLAAQFSERAYEKPRGAEREAHLDASWRNGTRAVVIKSVPMDHMNTIVFAVRGTATFMDWVVNLNTAPASPAGFLEDAGNLCHAGFLSTARGLVRPVAARLRQLLAEEPRRAKGGYSLLITGHSAGGAVASLLYCHMLSALSSSSPGVEKSELSALTGRFRRVHCVTFGAPPVSLLPLAKPDREALRKSLFLSFVNEGDPVARADPAYVRALLALYAAPPPPVVTATGWGGGGGGSSTTLPGKSGGKGEGRSPREKMSKSSLSSNRTGKSSAANKQPATTSTDDATRRRVVTSGPVWKVPQATLSSAGRIVVLRSGNAGARPRGRKTVEERLNEGVVAQVTTDEQLREVIWGDPVCHLMRLYAGRIETLAVGAVTARGY